MSDRIFVLQSNVQPTYVGLFLELFYTRSAVGADSLVLLRTSLRPASLPLVEPDIRHERRFA